MASRAPMDRDQTVSAVLLGVLPERMSGRRALIIGDHTGELEVGILARGGQPNRWDRHARRGRAATPWPEGPGADLAVLRLPRGKARLELALHAIAAKLEPGGALFVAGANDEGSRSLKRPLSAIFEQVESVDTRHHCRAWAARRPTDVPLLKPTLAHWREHRALATHDPPRSWVSYPGVFAGGELDAATKALLDHAPRAAERVLDFACGIGILGGTLGGGELHLLDSDAVAITAARENVPEATCWLSDGWQGVPNLPLDLIVSNPPLHRGNDRDHSVLLDLITGARRRLTRGGSLWIVTQRQVNPELAEVFSEVQVPWEDGRYRIWRAARAR